MITTVWSKTNPQNQFTIIQETHVQGYRMPPNTVQIIAFTYTDKIEPCLLEGSDLELHLQLLYSWHSNMPSLTNHSNIYEVVPHSETGYTNTGSISYYSFHAGRTKQVKPTTAPTKNGRLHHSQNYKLKGLTTAL